MLYIEALCQYGKLSSMWLGFRKYVDRLKITKHLKKITHQITIIHMCHVSSTHAEYISFK